MDEKNAKGRTGRNKKRTVIVSVVLLVLVAVAALLLVFLPGKEEKGADAVPITIHQASDLEIETPYCTLHYPIQWKDSVKAVAYEQNEKYTLVMLGTFAGQEQELFSVVFGESTEMPVGKLKTEAGETVTVRLNADMLTVGEGWTDEETERAYAMLQDSGYMLEILAQQDNFK